jgi:hypothetical protein
MTRPGREAGPVLIQRSETDTGSFKAKLSMDFSCEARRTLTCAGPQADAQSILVKVRYGYT